MILKLSLIILCGYMCRNIDVMWSPQTEIQQHFVKWGIEFIEFFKDLFLFLILMAYYNPDKFKINTTTIIYLFDIYSTVPRHHTYGHGAWRK